MKEEDDDVVGYMHMILQREGKEEERRKRGEEYWGRV